MSTHTATRPAVGQAFTKTDARTYTIDGIKREHDRTTLNVVTATNQGGFEYRTESVVAETDRPDFAGTPTGGEMAWFGWDAAVAKGRIQLVG